MTITAEKFQQEIETLIKKQKNGYIDLISWATQEPIMTLSFGTYIKHHTGLYNLLKKFSHSQKTRIHFFDDLYFPLKSQTLAELIEIREGLKRDVYKSKDERSSYEVTRFLGDWYAMFLERQEEEKIRLYDQLKKTVVKKLDDAKTAVEKAKALVLLKKESLLTADQSEVVALVNFKKDKISALNMVLQQLDYLLAEIESSRTTEKTLTQDNYPTLGEVNAYLGALKNKVHVKVGEVRKNLNIFEHEGIGYYFNKILQTISFGFARIRTNTVEIIDQTYEKIDLAI